MNQANRVMLQGNLTKDPERGQSDKAPVLLRVANNEEWGSKENRQKHTNYFDVVAFDKLGELCRSYLRKGSRVFVEGRMRYEEWEKDGKRHSRVKVVAERVHFLDSREGGEGEQRERQPATQRRQDPGPPARSNRAEPDEDYEDDLPF